MAGRKPNHLSTNNVKRNSVLAEWIREELKNTGMTQRDLATASGMSESKVCRILRGKSARLTELDINQLALALGKTIEERDNLRYLAWPELYEIDKALRRRDGCVTVTNCELAQHGLPLLGNNYEE